MRYWLILVLFLIAHTATAQKVELTKNEEGKFHYQEVIDAESLTDDHIYERAKEWVALEYRSAKDVIQLDDPDNKKLIAKGLFKSKNFGWQVWVWHTFHFEAREGRYRVTFTDFMYQADASAGEYPFEKAIPNPKKMRSRTAKQVETAITSLKELVMKPKEDW